MFQMFFHAMFKFYKVVPCLFILALIELMELFGQTGNDLKNFRFYYVYDD
jgi:hypothetical protein